MVKQRSIGGDTAEDGDSPSQFLDALRKHALDDLRDAALEYGIILKDLAVIDRLFKGQYTCLFSDPCRGADPDPFSQVRSPAR